MDNLMSCHQLYDTTYYIIGLPCLDRVAHNRPCIITLSFQEYSFKTHFHLTADNVDFIWSGWVININPWKHFFQKRIQWMVLTYFHTYVYSVKWNKIVQMFSIPYMTIRVLLLSFPFLCYFSVGLKLSLNIKDVTSILIY